MPEMEERLFVGGGANGRIHQVDKRISYVDMRDNAPPFCSASSVTPNQKTFSVTAYRKETLNIQVMIPMNMATDDAEKKLVEGFRKGSRKL
jgi:hypothetical protein